VSKDMQALHESARDAGVVLVNEAGLDPGIDHMSAMKVINDCKTNGENLKKFSSVCGGLPAPEAIGNDNPFLYKFSWSPAGVLTAAKNSAQYLSDGKIVQVPGESLLSSAQAFHGWPSLNLEVLPNRDSTIYGDLYGISDTADSVFRGTLRYAGWSELMYGCKQLGLFDTTDSWSWMQILDQKMTPKTKAALDWLGVNSHTQKANGQSPITAFGHLLQQRLMLEKHERDLVLMQHDFETETSDGQIRRRQSSLMVFGDSNGDTAMARTVGLTAGISAEVVLQGCLSSKPGVVVPTIPELYEPVLGKLEKEGIIFEER
jgi:alpha-aminoadipic semialdehyde synthase